MSKPETSKPWLIGLDIDGTILHQNGLLAKEVTQQIRRVQNMGHRVMLSTGRSIAMTKPVIKELKLRSEYVVCSNGAMVLRWGGQEYQHDLVETFTPREVLTTVRTHLAGAAFAVEDQNGKLHFTEDFPEREFTAGARHARFEDLLKMQATRVVVVSPEHELAEFLDVVEGMGLNKVSYNIGWTSWLDIAPDGINKATGMEYVRHKLKIPRERVLVMGDGRNDIDMFRWAVRGGGAAVAMGQAPDEVRQAANDRTGTDEEAGVAQALARYFPEHPLN